MLAYVIINVIQEWGTKYSNEPIVLVRNCRYEVEMDKEEIRMFMQAYDQLNNHITNTMLTYV